MIICTDRKIVVYFNPKAGGISIQKTFAAANVSPTIFEKSYYNYNNINLHSNLPNDDFSKYKHFVFYRNPIERAYSAYIFFKRSNYKFAVMTQRPHLFHALEKNELDLKFERTKQGRAENDYSLSDYYLLDSAIIEEIESIKIKNIIDSKPFFSARLKQSYNVYTKFEPQINWLDYNLDITYLNYANFSDEVRRLLTFFDVDSVEPVINRKPIYQETDAPFDAQDLEYLNTLYKPDFDFFAAKGLTV